MARASATRAELLERQAAAMRDFTASAVLFQDAIARQGGLNSTDLQTVGVLMSSGPATPGELAERIGLSTGGAITALIDRLEKAGYVTRQRDPVDRRRVVVSAVPERVYAAVGPIYAGVTERWNAYLATLDDAQLALASEVLENAAAVNHAEIGRLRGSDA
ncbi:MAG: MarR family transcriptional regulator [Pseudolysinimonas sp.]